jgi:hypothetical protein
MSAAFGTCFAGAEAGAGAELLLELVALAHAQTSPARPSAKTVVNRDILAMRSLSRNIESPSGHPEALQRRKSLS